MEVREGGRRKGGLNCGRRTSRIEEKERGSGDKHPVS